MEEPRSLKDWLSQYPPPTTKPKPPIILKPNKWQEVRLFLSSSFIDTHAESDILVRHVIPRVNRKLASKFIRIIAMDLRWGLLGEESKDCQAIQKTCLNLVEACKDHPDETPWFLALRTQRYGWNQEMYQSSNGFNKPEKFKSLDTLKQSVSITSLECLHATLISSSRNIKPKVFVYERTILNPENIEPHLRWVFDFEYLDENQDVQDEVKLQYTKTSQASTYKRDQEDLNDFLRSCDGLTVTYRKYNCSYKQGYAEITGQKSDGKHFGIGRVSEIEGFAQKVEHDLLESITANFKTADLTNIPDHKLQNIPFENAMHEKASNFVGRETMLQECFEFCKNGSDLTESTSVHVVRDDTGRNGESSNILIVHGQPGSGKSGLTAALSKKCIEELREKGNFIFVHGVDTCSNSANLLSMLRRLHLNLKLFSKNSDYDSQTLSDVKQNHISYLEKTAREHPDKLFLVIVDAINQFLLNFQAHSMWWVKLCSPPPNLRMVISTLNKENKTFDNACKVYPNALKVAVPEMATEDATKVVKNLFSRYSKKLTADQMNALLIKSKYPLFLTSAAQALRTFGVYEQLGDYIEKLPHELPKLFEFLLCEWITEYGEEFIRDVCSIICLSKDGILENTLNEVLLFIEEKEHIHYNGTFSRLYDAIREFLSAGGAGQMRFFHDQLNKVVKKKFISSPSYEYKMHRLLFHYYIEKVSPQLCEKPNTSTPLPYDSFLSAVVHHEINIFAGEKNTNEYFLSTLRNVFYIRERVNMGQQDGLLQDYNSAVLNCTNVETVKVLREWNKFATSYTPYILRYGSSLSLYNIVKQQPPTSHVFKDTSIGRKANDGIQQPRESHVFKDIKVRKVNDTMQQPTTSHVLKDTSVERKLDDAMQQPNTSHLFRDTQIEGKVSCGMQQPPTGHVPNRTTVEEKVNHGYQLIWSNPPVREAEDDVMLSYGVEGSKVYTCCVEVVGGVRLLCVGGNNGVDLFEVDTGVMLHRIVLNRNFVSSVHISPTSRTFWCGDERGNVSVLSIDTGDLLWSEHVHGEVIWLCGVNGKVLCQTRTRFSKISVFIDNDEYSNILQSWKIYTYRSCAYLRSRDVMLSGHSDGVVKMWSMSGEMVHEVYVGDGVLREIRCLTPHPKDDVVAIAFPDKNYMDEDKVKVFNLTTEKELLTIPFLCGHEVKYDNTGDRMFTTLKGCISVLVLDSEGKRLNRLHGPNSDIKLLCVVPGTGDLIAVGDNDEVLKLPGVKMLTEEGNKVNKGEDSGECMLVKGIKSLGVEVENEVDAGDSEASGGWVENCGLLAGGKEFFTINEVTKYLQIWNVETLNCVRSVKAQGNHAVAHCTQQLLIVYEKQKNVLWLVDATHLITISKLKLKRGIKNVTMSPLGDKCVIVGADYGVPNHVIDIKFRQSSLSCTSDRRGMMKKKCNLSHSGVKYKMNGLDYSCDIHNDGVHVVSGSGNGADLWDIRTGERINKLVEGKGVYHLRFMQNDLLYEEYNVGIHLISLDGTHLRTFDSFNKTFKTLRLWFVYDEHYMISKDNNQALSVWDLNTGEHLYTFIDHRTKPFTCFLELPTCVVGYNEDERRYIFKCSRVAETAYETTIW